MQIYLLRTVSPIITRLTDRIMAGLYNMKLAHVLAVGSNLMAAAERIADMTITSSHLSSIYTVTMMVFNSKYSKHHQVFIHWVADSISPRLPP